MNNHSYNKHLKEYAHELRNFSVSRTEKFLWKALLCRNKMGVKFKRQRPISNYIVDFFSQEIQLIIKIDGNSHINKGNYDLKRQQEIEELGMVFLRFKEGEVLNNIGEVHARISHAVFCLKRGRIEIKISKQQYSFL